MGWKIGLGPEAQNTPEVSANWNMFHGNAHEFLSGEFLDHGTEEHTRMKHEHVRFKRITPPSCWYSTLGYGVLPDLTRRRRRASPR